MAHPCSESVQGLAALVKPCEDLIKDSVCMDTEAVEVLEVNRSVDWSAQK